MVVQSLQMYSLLQNYTVGRLLNLHWIVEGDTCTAVTSYIAWCLHSISTSRVVLYWHGAAVSHHDMGTRRAARLCHCIATCETIRTRCRLD